MSAPGPSGAPTRRAPLWFPPVGTAIGLVGTLCGIGGGLFAGPLMHFVRGLALKRAAASALLLVFATTTASTVTELLRPDSLLTLELVLPVALGVVVGAQLGFHVSQRLSERGLKYGFAFVLFFAGLRILLFDGARDAAAVAPLELGARDVLMAAAVGLGGGFVAPLLGVGGGLLMVPGLFFALGGLPFTVARATSLAAGSVGALRSLWLHGRAGNLDVALGLPLAAGALFGAVAGVFVVRDPTFVQVGRVLLGLILVGQGVRFGLELRR